MPRAASDDLTLLAERLRLGIPLAGFDGQAIPLVDAAGRVVDPIEAADALLRSGASLLPRDEVEPYIEGAIARAQAIETEAAMAGEPLDAALAKVTGVLVSAAVRATVIARARHASPGDLNRATISWFRSQELRARQLLDAGTPAAAHRLPA